MSLYNKPDFKVNYGTNTPSYTHKKNNSLNFTTNPGKFLQDNANKFQRSKLELKTNPKSNENTENNIIKYNNYMTSNPNINKLLTSTNKNNRRIEINLNKNYSPTAKLNKSTGENIILLRHKQSTSQNNINNKISNNENNSNKECNIIINNNINDTKDKYNNKNKNLNNINININISKKIISTYYNKSRDKKNLVVKKKSLSSMTNSDTKDNENNKYYKKNSKDELKKSNYDGAGVVKNQSSNILKKFSNYESSMNNINNITSTQSKNSMNHNSLGHFSTNSNMSTNTNKNNNHISKSNINNYKNNINKNNHINYTSNDIYNDNNSNNKENNKKNQGSVLNKIIKENKSMYLSQIQIPINSSCSPRNINSIQNYLKYLNLGQNNSKNYKNSPYNRSKYQKLSANNINYIHNNTENNIYNNTYNYDYSNNAFTPNSYHSDNNNYINAPKDENDNNIIQKKSPSKSTYMTRRNKNSNQKYSNSNSEHENKEVIGPLIESPEELHYFYVKIFQKGNNINFDNK